MQFASTMFKGAAVAAMLAGAPPALAATQAYRVELAGPVIPAGAKQHAVSVRIIHSADNKPVVGAAVTSARLDMSPENMASMTAPVRETPDTKPEVYTFTFDDNMVWAERAKWALTITAKVQGESKPVTGSVVFQAGQ